MAVSAKRFPVKREFWEDIMVKLGEVVVLLKDVKGMLGAVS